MNKKQKKNLYRIIAALVLVLILKLLPQFPTPVELLLYCIPYLVVGWDVLRKALLGIKNRQPFDECFLMAVATVGAFALGDYVEGCAVIIFYQIGELFQSVAVGKSRQSIASLMDIRPDYANIEGEDGKLEQVDPDEVEIGTTIVVQPGERVPIDGVIVEGMKFFKAKPGMTKIGGDFCYPLPRLRHDFEAIKAECHRYGLKFYSGENRLRAMGDSMTCCGIDGLPGFRPNEYNLCMLMNGKNPEPTEKMKEVGTGGPFKTLNQSAGSGRKIAKQSFYGLMQEELAKKTDYHRKVFGLDE